MNEFYFLGAIVALTLVNIVIMVDVNLKDDQFKKRQDKQIKLDKAHLDALDAIYKKISEVTGD